MKSSVILPAKMDDLKNISKNFVLDLEKANSGNESSLPYIIHEMPEFSLVSEGEEFQVLVVGGTYGLSARVRKVDGKCSILSCHKTSLPILSKKEDFYDYIEQHVLPDIHVLVINLAFAVQPVFEKGRLDGVLMHGSKEHMFKGLVGEKVGESVEHLFESKMGRKIVVSVANDTVCLLLSGLEVHSSENLGAGVLGSGMNFALFIDPHKLVNLESANFNKFPLSLEAQEIDEISASPGAYLYEKEVAGVYLFKHFNILLRKNNLDKTPISSTEELDNIARLSDDKEGLLARGLIKRSAQLIACQIAGIMEFKKSDMAFVMEGSLFWKGFEYKETVEEALKALTNYKASFVEVKNSGIIGAAHLVM